MTPLEMVPAQVHARVAGEVTGCVDEVIRPAAVLPESSARKVLVELAYDDVRAGGCWATSPMVWERYDRPWDGADGGPGDAVLLGSLKVRYGAPTRYAITIYRASVTDLAKTHGWTIETLCDDALAYGGYTLAGCPRADLRPQTRPVRVSA